MIDFIKQNLFIAIIFIITLSVGFITFLTFIDKSFITLNELNLQILLISNIVLLILFFIIIFLEIKNSLKDDINTRGSRANRKYIAFFSLFTLIPSILISIFSLFLFSFALDKYLDKKITTAVNNSYEIAKNYVDDVRNKIESDIVLIGYDLNNNINIYYDNPNRYKNILRTQKLLREVDEIHLVDSLGNLIISTLENKNDFIPPTDEALEMVFNEERPLKIINAFENKSAAILKLGNYIDTYLYVVKYLDQEISNYLTESEEAINFYYTVEDKSVGIKISFILIYIVVVTLLLFLSISVAIKFSSRFFRSITNLISASLNIGKGNLDTKVPEIKTDVELEILNKNFNLMIDQLKQQQEKLLINERHEAWENVARKLAHEIKNPLTPIQLTIDRLKNKYTDTIDSNSRSNFNDHLKNIIKQIRQIENLVNEFSDFARMPKPIFKKNNLINILNQNILLMRELDTSIKINFTNNKDQVILVCDSEQIGRVFLNLIKNSVESIQEKFKKTPDFAKNIDIELIEENDYITFNITDNGTGFSENNLKSILKPYFTTKTKGSGLGLSIVNKIINDHNGTINFIPIKNGAQISIRFIKNDS
ncbi:ATP-binding protein [Candidatus Pelagibacter sp.]|nr:ATP-binding protein [Candidatus Pelagibacter sp.]